MYKPVPFLGMVLAGKKHVPQVRFTGYVEEHEVPALFKESAVVVFPYTSTTGSSGVLHQAAIYGTPAAYPMMGDFIDVTEREGLKGFNFKPLDQAALETAIQECLTHDDVAQSLAQNNIDISKGVTMHTVASIQLQLLKKIKSGNFNTVRRAKNSAVMIRQNMVY